MEVCLSSATRDAAHPESQFVVPFSGAAAETAEMAVPPLPPPHQPLAAACGDASDRPVQPVRPVRPGPSPTPSFASTSRSCSQDEVLQTPDLYPCSNLPLEHPHAHPHSHGAHGLGLGLGPGRQGPVLGPAHREHAQERDTALMPPQRTSTPPVRTLSSPVAASPLAQRGSYPDSPSTPSSRQRSPTGDNDYGLGFDFTFLAPADQAVIMMAWTAQQPGALVASHRGGKR